MSGGTLYLYDPEGTVHDHLSAGVYEIELLESADDERVRDLLERFLAETGSKKTERILAAWRQERMNFVRIETSEYQRIRDEVKGG
jgi:glutamate synthase (NADPH/NADH) large chain